VRIVGLGLGDPSAVAGFEFNASKLATSALTTQIIQQQHNFNATVFANQHQAKIDFVTLCRQRQASLVSQITPSLPVLQKLTGENLQYATANVEDEAHCSRVLG